MSPRTLTTRLGASDPAIMRTRHGSSPRSNTTGRSPDASSPRTTHAPMQPNAPVTSVVTNENIMPLVFQSERFFREAWPQISQSVESGTDAASDVQWIAGATGLETGARVLDAPCGFGRHSVEFARRDCETTGVDFSETELGRGRRAAGEAGVSLALVCQDIRDMEFSSEFDLAVNLFSSIGYFSEDEDRLVLDPFLRAPKPGRPFVVAPRNPHQCRAPPPPQKRMRRGNPTIRARNESHPPTCRWRAPL